MATKTFFRAITALIVSFLFCITAVQADATFLPMAKRGEIPNPSVLADRIAEALAVDSSGNSQVRGANISTQGFLIAVRTAGGTVGNVQELPVYLRSLQSRLLPKDVEMSLCRATLQNNIYKVDVSEGWSRLPHPGELGWYDMNTGYLILAGDCSNSPIRPYRLDIPKVIITTGYKKSESSKWVDPYAKYDNPMACGLGMGSENERWLTIHMLEAAASEHVCSQQYMLPPDARVQGDPGNWLSDNRFSRQCGEILDPLREDAPYGFSSAPLNIEVFIVMDDQEKFSLFSGTVTGNKLATTDLHSEQVLSADKIAIWIPNVFNKGIVVVQYTDPGSVRTPTEVGNGEDVNFFVRRCGATVITGIESQSL